MMEHSITGEPSWHMDNFDLDAIDVQESKRNFPGIEESTFYDLNDIRNGDWSGTTDTDIETEEHEYLGKTKDQSRSPGKENPYTKVNQTKGKSRSYSKQSSPRVKNPNEKPDKKIKDPLAKGKSRG